MKKKGFTLVELMVVVAIIAILAAVSLPMYTRFKQKAEASKPIKVCQGIVAALQTWHSDESTFDTFALDPADPDTGARPMMAVTSQGVGPLEIGTGFPALDDITWTLIQADAEYVVIGWANSAARCDVCDGQFCMRCNSAGCVTQILMVTEELGLSKFQDPNFPGCP